MVLLHMDPFIPPVHARGKGTKGGALFCPHDKRAVKAAPAPDIPYRTRRSEFTHDHGLNIKGGRHEARPLHRG